MLYTFVCLISYYLRDLKVNAKISKAFYEGVDSGLSVMNMSCLPCRTMCGDVVLKSKWSKNETK